VLDAELGHVFSFAIPENRIPEAGYYRDGMGQAQTEAGTV
jgi:hypothetical protein